MNLYYQQLAINQRWRHRGKKGEYWPDKPESAPAVSRYPNILAELDASTKWLDRMAKYAMVSMEIMASAMEDNGELSQEEMEGVSRCFGCSMSYLRSPILSMVDPASNKGRVRIQHLKDLLRRTEGMDRFFYRTYSKDVLPTLESGKPVTYAAYRWACKNLQDVLDWNKQGEAMQRQTRTGKLPLVQNHQESLKNQLAAARERARVRAWKTRIDAMMEYAEGEHGFMSIQNMLDLAEFAGQDVAGAILLAAHYGYAAGREAVQ